MHSLFLPTDKDMFSLPQKFLDFFWLQIGFSGQSQENQPFSPGSIEYIHTLITKANALHVTQTHDLCSAASTTWQLLFLIKFFWNP